MFFVPILRKKNDAVIVLMGGHFVHQGVTELE